MRPRTLVAVAVAIAVIAGFVLNNRHSDQVRLVQQDIGSAAQAAPARDTALADVVARQERSLAQKAAAEERALTRDQRDLAEKIARDERALAQKAALEQAALREAGRAGQQARVAATAQTAPDDAVDPQPPTGERAAVQPDAGRVSDDAMAITDQNASAEGSADGSAVASGEDDPATDAGIADEADSALAVAAPDTAGQAADGPTAPAGDGQADAEGTAGRTTMAELEHLLTLETFDHDAVVALIDDAADLNLGKRLALRALAEGATAATSMAETAIGSIRESLDLPPVN